MLRHKTFQNKIAVSRFSLPVTATLIAMIWVAVGLVQGDIWTGSGVCTRLYPSHGRAQQPQCPDAYLQPHGVVQFPDTPVVTSLPEPSLHAKRGDPLFHCLHPPYLEWLSGNRQSTGRTFYAFACLGIASMEFVQILYYLPILWAMMMVFTNSFSLPQLCSLHPGSHHPLLVLRQDSLSIPTTSTTSSLILPVSSTSTRCSTIPW